jgi:DNA-binding HxlR family transcriptional regulator
MVERTLDVIGNKWTTLIIRELLSGTRRFGELRAALTGISPKTLSDRLKELEAHGVITRRIYAEVPPRVEYDLTSQGLELKPILDAMGAWGARWRGK